MNRLNPGVFSSATPEWETPQALFDVLNARFAFTLDVCARPENAKCARFFTPEQDGLAASWAGHRCWMNPPYGREINMWVEKATKEAGNGALVVGLLPARTDTRWWHEHVDGHASIHFFAGRLVFGNAGNAAPFPSALAVWWGWSFVKKSVGSRKNRYPDNLPGLLTLADIFPEGKAGPGNNRKEVRCGSFSS